MCGLLLYVGKKKISSQLFKESLELQNHRGPDNSQIFVKNNSTNKFSKNYNNEEYNFLIGHNRLSIIDLSEESNQPIFNQNGKNFLLFNGEFYNFRDFVNQENKFSDTKTLFSGLESEGVRFYEKVNGPWASVYGISDRLLFLSRDLYGKKPLYYYKDNYRFIVSSEIKSIYKILNVKREVNLDNLVYFLGNKLSPYVTDGTTFYKNIHSVKPGQSLAYDLIENDIKHYSQINLEHPQSYSFGKDPIETISQFENELQNSIDLRFEADAKVGMSVSGGVDSLLILSFLNKKKLNDTNFYTIYDDTSNEDYKYVAKLRNKLNFKLIEIPLTYNFNLFENYLNILSQKMEVPVNFHATAIPTLIISDQMKKDKIKVCIDGIGGDEIMGGYPIFADLARANLKKNNLFESIKNLTRYYNFKRPNFGSFLYTAISILNYGFFNKSKLHSGQKKNQSIIDVISNIEIKDRFTRLNHNLISDKVLNLKDHQLLNIKSNLLPYYIGIADSVNMTSSIENRSPFLDKRLFKYVFMSESLKYRKGFNKYMLRKLLSSKIGTYYGFRKNKSGFKTFHGEKFVNEKKNLEIIFDSAFIRNIFSSDINNVLKGQNPFVKRQLLSLAYLDNSYNLNI
ncbi:hypothetical protein IDH26_03935 [Pelagibacterales bacterium SAG-MED50]|nr:hypothetical protein [Pelagibacterales bacterium SAG-MED50]